MDPIKILVEALISFFEGVCQVLAAGLLVLCVCVFILMTIPMWFAITLIEFLSSIQRRHDD